MIPSLSGWSRLDRGEAADALATLIGNELLARDIVASVEAALDDPGVVLDGGSVGEVIGRVVWEVIADVQRDERALLLRRFLRVGPKDEEEPQEGDEHDECAPPVQREESDSEEPDGSKPPSDAELPLTDAEGGELVEFIHSRMVSRFKGDLAELLAIRPVLGIVEGLRGAGALSRQAVLYWGSTIAAPGIAAAAGAAPGGSGVRRAHLKAADGVVVEPVGGANGEAADPWAMIQVAALVEVKSMRLPEADLARQLDQHEERLRGGLRLGDREWKGPQIRTANDGSGSAPGTSHRPTRIGVVPAGWKVTRHWRSVQTAEGRRIESGPRVIPAEPPPAGDKVAPGADGLRGVTLAWSKEALEEAAYALTFRYIADLGLAEFGASGPPRELDGMSAEEAGQNNIRAMLYALILRPITSHQRRTAIKLYNIYSFGYGLAIDSKGMLWPEDFPDPGSDELKRAPRLGPSAFPMTFEYNFRDGLHGWQAGFADYPVADAEIYHLESGLRPLPASVGRSGGGFYLSGTNRSDDLVMFLTRREGGLVPMTTYDVAFRVGFATNAPSGCVGVGGAPGESVFVKAGVSVRKPAVRVEEGMARLAIDIGAQSNGGRDAIVLGNVASSSRDCRSAPYEMKLLSRPPGAFTVTTGKSGAVWLFVGTDSGFESTTSLYYRCIRVTLIPR